MSYEIDNMIRHHESSFALSRFVVIQIGLESEYLGLVLQYFHCVRSFREVVCQGFIAYPSSWSESRPCARKPVGSYFVFSKPML